MSDIQEINIEAIMQEIREDIKTKGYKETDLKFNDIPIPKSVSETLTEGQTVSNDLKELLNVLNADYLHDVLQPLEPTSNGMVYVIKKLIRKVVLFLFYPILVHQNNINSRMVNAINILANQYETNAECNRRIRDLEEEITNLRHELINIESNNR